MLCPRQGANCCYIDNVKLLQDLIKKSWVRLAISSRVRLRLRARTYSWYTGDHTNSVTHDSVHRRSKWICYWFQTQWLDQSINCGKSRIERVAKAELKELKVHCTSRLYGRQHLITLLWINMPKLFKKFTGAYDR